MSRTAATVPWRHALDGADEALLCVAFIHARGDDQLPDVEWLTGAVAVTVTSLV